MKTIIFLLVLIVSSKVFATPTLDTSSYYTILEVSKEASQADIKKAYYRLAKKYAPDINGQASTEDFQLINEAFQVLGESSRRSQYDFGQPIPGFKSGFNMASGGDTASSSGGPTRTVEPAAQNLNPQTLDDFTFAEMLAETPSYLAFKEMIRDSLVAQFGNRNYFGVYGLEGINGRWQAWRQNISGSLVMSGIGAYMIGLSLFSSGMADARGVVLSASIACALGLEECMYKLSKVKTEEAARFMVKDILPLIHHWRGNDRDAAKAALLSFDVADIIKHFSTTESGPYLALSRILKISRLFPNARSGMLLRAAVGAGPVHDLDEPFRLQVNSHPIYWSQILRETKAMFLGNSAAALDESLRAKGIILNGNPTSVIGSWASSLYGQVCERLLR